MVNRMSVSSSLTSDHSKSSIQNLESPSTPNDRPPRHQNRIPGWHPLQHQGGEDNRTVSSGLIFAAFQLRSSHRYALHPVEAALQYHCSPAEIIGTEGHGAGGFEQAEVIYRTGAQGLRLPEIPQLPQQLRELSRLSVTDRAGRKALRIWAEGNSGVFDEALFFARWNGQGKRGGAEHQVYFDQELHPVTGVLAHDLHDENVVHLPESDALVVIDPYISLARRGTWAAMKLAEVGFPIPPDDPGIPSLRQ